jgi:hypothetical protein
MADRMTAERDAVEDFGRAVAIANRDGMTSHQMMREFGIGLATFTLVVAHLDAVTRERDEARVVTDEMVMAAIRAWDKAYSDFRKDNRSIMRAALTAALHCQSPQLDPG